MRLRHIISTLTIATLPMGAMAQGLSSGLNLPTWTPPCAQATASTSMLVADG